MEYSLYKHQQDIIDQAPNKWLLAWECGTGKSLAAIKLAEVNSKYGSSVLVICPKSIVDKWYKEIAKFKDDRGMRWTVMSKETFKKNVSGMIKNKSFKNGTLIIDEAHYFTGMQGFIKKSRLLTDMLNFIRLNAPNNIYCLTATPYLSTPWNVFALGLIFGKNWDYMEYKNYFFHMVNMGGRFPVPIIKKHIEPQIAQLVSKLGNTIRMDQCVDVPEQTFITETFDLTPTQINAIEKLDDTVPIARWTKTHQICGGTLKGDGYVDDKHFKCEKLDRLIDLCNEHKKIVVVCRYNAEIDYIAKKLKYKNVYTLNGKTKHRGKVIEIANQATEAVVLVNAAVSEGYELPDFPIMVFYSYDFSLKNYLQIIGRIQRINNIKKNVYISLVVEGTIDEDVKKCIDNKCDFDCSIYGKDK